MSFCNNFFYLQIFAERFIIILFARNLFFNFIKLSNKIECK